MISLAIFINPICCRIDWDTKMISMWQSTGNEYAILSTKPPDIKSLGLNVDDNFEVPHVCESSFTK